MCETTFACVAACVTDNVKCSVCTRAKRVVVCSLTARMTLTREKQIVSCSRCAKRVHTEHIFQLSALQDPLPVKDEVLAFKCRITGKLFDMFLHFMCDIGCSLCIEPCARSRANNDCDVS